LIKPVDGVGCLDSGLLSVLGMPENCERFIVQPHLQGDKTSLSCLFKGGAAWLLCVNRQQFSFESGRYQLTGIEVNIAVNVERYLPLLDKLARAFPELWGYVGVDLIETEDALLVLEINPRLTSSFVGIQAATGVNVCVCVMQLLNATPVIMPTHSQTIQLTL
jgi:predicted ATP-grasp superfamily ATP-dependent carboligase